MIDSTDVTQSIATNNWPAVSKAYDFVIPSYQLLTSRFEAADTRLTALLAFTSTVTLAVPIFAKSVYSNISFGSFFFWSGMAIFLVGAIIGLVGRATGSITLPDPMVIYRKSLSESEWEFEKNQIYFAGKNFEANLRAIRRKGNLSMIVTVALLLEIVAFITWIVG